MVHFVHWSECVFDLPLPAKHKKNMVGTEAHLRKKSCNCLVVVHNQKKETVNLKLGMLKRIFHGWLDELKKVVMDAGQQAANLTVSWEFDTKISTLSFAFPTPIFKGNLCWSLNSKHLNLFLQVWVTFSRASESWGCLPGRPQSPFSGGPRMRQINEY